MQNFKFYYFFIFCPVLMDFFFFFSLSLFIQFIYLANGSDLPFELDIVRHINMIWIKIFWMCNQYSGLLWLFWLLHEYSCACMYYLNIVTVLSCITKTQFHPFTDHLPICPLVFIISLHGNFTEAVQKTYEQLCYSKLFNSIKAFSLVTLISILYYHNVVISIVPRNLL